MLRFFIHDQVTINRNGERTSDIDRHNIRVRNGQYFVLRKSVKKLDFTIIIRYSRVIQKTAFPK